MIKKTLTYKNFDKDITKDFHFGLFEADFMELEALWQEDGGFDGRIELVKRGDNHILIMQTFKELIERSFGVRAGDEFYRPEKERERFLTSDAYSKLLVGLLTLDGPEWDAAAFMQGILPDSVMVQMNAGDNPASQQARAASEARMQGFQQSQQPAKDEGFQKVELPTAAPTAAPTLPPLEDDPEWVAFQAAQKKEPELTPEQQKFLEWKASQKQS